MRNKILTFELPVDFLPKISLNLEALFKNIEQSCVTNDPIVHHFALNNLIKVIKLIEKPELKSRYIKELIRIEHLINKSEQTISNHLYARLFVQIQILSHISGRFGESIHHDLFIGSLKYLDSLSNSDVEVQEPQLLFWLEKEATLRQKNLISWLGYLRTLWDTVDIYLSILRELAVFEQINLENGFYNKPLPTKKNHHLITIRMSHMGDIVPKMQLTHNSLSVRLYDAYSMSEISHSPDSIF